MTEQPDKARTDALIADLRKVPAFAGLASEDLEWFIGRAEERWAKPGDPVSTEGAPADTMLVLLEGEMRGRREADGPDAQQYTVAAPSVSGFLPFSRMKTIPMTARAVTLMHVLALHSQHFPEMLHRMPLLAQRLVGVLTDRVRSYTLAGQQREKLAALPQLSAIASSVSAKWAALPPSARRIAQHWPSAKRKFAPRSSPQISRTSSSASNAKKRSKPGWKAKTLPT